MTTDSRRTHVIRIIGQNKNGDLLPDIWVDIERIDVIRTTYRDKKTGQWQEEYIRLHWKDDPDSSDASWNTDNRLIGTLMICGPDQDPADPDEFIAVNCIIATAFNQSGQVIARGIRSDSSNETRLLSARRIYHRSTSMDEDAQRAFENDTTRKVYMVAGDEYQLRMEDEEKDAGQYLDVCVFAQSWYGDFGDDFQGTLTGHYNTYLLDISDKSSDFIPDDNPNSIGPFGYNPPWVLDQFQNIVNVQFRSIYAVDMLICGYGGTDGESYMIFGVRGDAFMVVDSGTRFGDGPVVASYTGSIEGSRSIDPVIQAIGERIVSYDASDEGVMIIGSPGWYVDAVAGPEWGSATIYTHFDSIDAGDIRAAAIDLTGGMGMDYWENKGGLGTALGQSPPNGDVMTYEDEFTRVLKDKDGNVKANIELNEPTTQTLENGTVIVMRGQDHREGMVMGKGGKAWFYIIQDYDDPEGSGILTYLPGDDPFSDSLVPMPYQNELTTYFRVFDKDGNELPSIPWGKTISQSQVIGGAEGDAFSVVVGDEYAYPTHSAALMAPPEE